MSGERATKLFGFACSRLGFCRPNLSSQVSASWVCDELFGAGVQVKRVIDPEAEALRLAEMRRLQRQMKGVKLQYIAENDTVFFDDVAGIGEAKVSHLPCLLALSAVLSGLVALFVTCCVVLCCLIA